MGEEVFDLLQRWRTALTTSNNMGKLVVSTGTQIASLRRHVRLLDLTRQSDVREQHSLR
jgi:hypothetical protein